MPRSARLAGGTSSDLALAALAAGASAALALLGGAVAITLVLAAALALLPRRPAVAWVPAVAALGIGAAAGVTSPLAWAALVPAHAFGAAWRTGPRTAGLALVALLGASVPGIASVQDNWVPYLLLIGAAWGVGRGVRSRDRLAATLAARARELEEEREAYGELSVRYERARIASELHDIVGHAISVMVVQASAGQRLLADPEGRAAAFGAIAGAARQAEQDMGRLVALLADEEPIGPAPDLQLIEELVARAAGSGLQVSLRLSGEREGLPVECVEVAYRVVQESLTNALRYAAGADVRVELRGVQRTLEVEVTNGPAPRAEVLAGQGGGRGLAGLGARLGACGGTLQAGPTAEGGWRLAASVPRLVASAP